MKIQNQMPSVKTMTTALLAATLATSACAAPSRSSSDEKAATQKLGRIYTFESDANGFNTKNFFYDNGEEVVAFDTQFTPELARKSIEFLRSRTSRPITYVVITHPNPDKFNGMSEFQKLGAKAIASSATAASLPGVHAYKKYYFVNMARMFTEESYPRLSHADQTFEHSLDLRLRNGETIALRELSQPGVSGNQTVALIPQAQAAIVGDLVHHQAHAWLEGGIVNGKPTPSVSGWLQDLAELRSAVTPETIIYGGRGESVPADQAIDAQISYLRQADQLVSAYAAELGQAKADYQVLQARFEKAFPAYKLGYMIGYGAYGLLDSKR